MFVKELPSEKKVVVVPSLGYLFQAPGTLEQVAEVSAQLFV